MPYGKWDESDFPQVVSVSQRVGHEGGFDYLNAVGPEHRQRLQADVGKRSQVLRGLTKRERPQSYGGGSRTARGKDHRGSRTSRAPSTLQDSRHGQEEASSNDTGSLGKTVEDVLPYRSRRVLQKWSAGSSQIGYVDQLSLASTASTDDLGNTIGSRSESSLGHGVSAGASTEAESVLGKELSWYEAFDFLAESKVSGAMLRELVQRYDGAAVMSGLNQDYLRLANVVSVSSDAALRLRRHANLAEAALADDEFACEGDQEEDLNFFSKLASGVASTGKQKGAVVLWTLNLLREILDEMEHLNLDEPISCLQHVVKASVDTHTALKEFIDMVAEASDEIGNVLDFAAVNADIRLHEKTRVAASALATLCDRFRHHLQVLRRGSLGLPYETIARHEANAREMVNMLRLIRDNVKSDLSSDLEIKLRVEAERHAKFLENNQTEKKSLAARSSTSKKPDDDDYNGNWWHVEEMLHRAYNRSKIYADNIAQDARLKKGLCELVLKTAFKGSQFIAMLYKDGKINLNKYVHSLMELRKECKKKIAEIVRPRALGGEWGDFSKMSEESLLEVARLQFRCVEQDVTLEHLLDDCVRLVEDVNSDIGRGTWKLDEVRDDEVVQLSCTFNVSPAEALVKVALNEISHLLGQGVFYLGRARDRDLRHLRQEFAKSEGKVGTPIVVDNFVSDGEDAPENDCSMQATHTSHARAVQRKEDAKLVDARNTELERILNLLEVLIKISRSLNMKSEKKSMRAPEGVDVEAQLGEARPRRSSPQITLEEGRMGLIKLAQSTNVKRKEKKGTSSKKSRVSGFRVGSVVIAAMTAVVLEEEEADEVAAPSAPSRRKANRRSQAKVMKTTATGETWIADEEDMCETSSQAMTPQKITVRSGSFTAETVTYLKGMVGRLRYQCEVNTSLLEQTLLDSVALEAENVTWSHLVERFEGMNKREATLQASAKDLDDLKYKLSLVRGQQEQLCAQLKSLSKQSEKHKRSSTARDSRISLSEARGRPSMMSSTESHRSSAVQVVPQVSSRASGFAMSPRQSQALQSQTTSGQALTGVAELGGPTSRGGQALTGVAVPGGPTSRGAVSDASLEEPWPHAETQVGQSAEIVGAAKPDFAESQSRRSSMHSMPSQFTAVSDGAFSKRVSLKPTAASAALDEVAAGKLARRSSAAGFAPKRKAQPLPSSVQFPREIAFFNDSNDFETKNVAAMTPREQSEWRTTSSHYRMKMLEIHAQLQKVSQKFRAISVLRERHRHEMKRMLHDISEKTGVDMTLLMADAKERQVRWARDMNEFRRALTSDCKMTDWWDARFDAWYQKLATMWSADTADLMRQKKSWGDQAAWHAEVLQEIMRAMRSKKEDKEAETQMKAREMFKKLVGALESADGHLEAPADAGGHRLSRRMSQRPARSTSGGEARAGGSPMEARDMMASFVAKLGGKQDVTSQFGNYRSEASAGSAPKVAGDLSEGFGEKGTLRRGISRRAVGQLKGATDTVMNLWGASSTNALLGALQPGGSKDTAHPRGSFHYGHQEPAGHLLGVVGVRSLALPTTGKGAGSRQRFSPFADLRLHGGKAGGKGRRMGAGRRESRDGEDFLAGSMDTMRSRRRSIGAMAVDDTVDAIRALRDQTKLQQSQGAEESAAEESATLSHVKKMFLNFLDDVDGDAGDEDADGEKQRKKTKRPKAKKAAAKAEHGGDSHAAGTRARREEHRAGGAEASPEWSLLTSGFTVQSSQEDTGRRRGSVRRGGHLASPFVGVANVPGQPLSSTTVGRRGSLASADEDPHPLYLSKLKKSGAAVDAPGLQLGLRLLRACGNKAKTEFGSLEDAFSFAVAQRESHTHLDWQSFWTWCEHLRFDEDEAASMFAFALEFHHNEDEGKLSKSQFVEALENVKACDTLEQLYLRLTQRYGKVSRGFADFSDAGHSPDVRARTMTKLGFRALLETVGLHSGEAHRFFEEIAQHGEGDRSLPGIISRRTFLTVFRNARGLAAAKLFRQMLAKLTPEGKQGDGMLVSSTGRAGDVELQPLVAYRTLLDFVEERFLSQPLCFSEFGAALAPFRVPQRDLQAMFRMADRFKAGLATFNDFASALLGGLGYMRTILFTQFEGKLRCKNEIKCLEEKFGYAVAARAYGYGSRGLKKRGRYIEEVTKREVAAMELDLLLKRAAAFRLRHAKLVKSHHGEKDKREADADDVRSACSSEAVISSHDAGSSASDAGDAAETAFASAPFAHASRGSGHPAPSPTDQPIDGGSSSSPARSEQVEEPAFEICAKKSDARAEDTRKSTFDLNALAPAANTTRKVFAGALSKLRLSKAKRVDGTGQMEGALSVGQKDTAKESKFTKRFSRTDLASEVRKWQVADHSAAQDFDARKDAQISGFRGRLELFEGDSTELQIATSRLQDFRAQLLSRFKTFKKAWEKLAGSVEDILDWSEAKGKVMKLLAYNSLDMRRILDLMETLQSDTWPIVNFASFLEVMRFALPVPSVLHLRRRLVQNFFSVERALSALSLSRTSGVDVGQFAKRLVSAGILSSDAQRLFRVVDAASPGGATDTLTNEDLSFALKHAHVLAFLEAFYSRVAARHRDVETAILSRCTSLAEAEGNATIANPVHLAEQLEPLGFPRGIAVSAFKFLQQHVRGEQVTLRALATLLSGAFAAEVVGNPSPSASTKLSPRSGARRFESDDMTHGGEDSPQGQATSLVTDDMREDALQSLRQLRERILTTYASYQEAFLQFQPHNGQEITCDQWKNALKLFGLSDAGAWEMVFGHLVGWRHIRWDPKFHGDTPTVTPETFVRALEDAVPCQTLTALKSRLGERFGLMSKFWVGLAVKESTDELSFDDWRRALCREASVTCEDAITFWSMIRAAPSGAVLANNNVANLTKQAFSAAMKGAEPIARLFDLLQAVSGGSPSVTGSSGPLRKDEQPNISPPKEGPSEQGSGAADQQGSSAAGAPGNPAANGLVCVSDHLGSERPASEVFEGGVFDLGPLSAADFELQMHKAFGMGAADARTIFFYLDPDKEGFVEIHDLLDALTVMQGAFLQYPLAALQPPTGQRRPRAISSDVDERRPRGISSDVDESGTKVQQRLSVATSGRRIQRQRQTLTEAAPSSPTSASSPAASSPDVAGDDKEVPLGTAVTPRTGSAAGRHTQRFSQMPDGHGTAESDGGKPQRASLMTGTPMKPSTPARARPGSIVGITGSPTTRHSIKVELDASPKETHDDTDDASSPSPVGAASWRDSVTPNDLINSGSVTPVVGFGARASSVCGHPGNLGLASTALPEDSDSDDAGPSVQTRPWTSMGMTADRSHPSQLHTNSPVSRSSRPNVNLNTRAAHSTPFSHGFPPIRGRDDSSFDQNSKSQGMARRTLPSNVNAASRSSGELPAEEAAVVVRARATFAHPSLPVLALGVADEGLSHRDAVRPRSSIARGVKRAQGSVPAVSGAVPAAGASRKSQVHPEKAQTASGRSGQSATATGRQLRPHSVVAPHNIAALEGTTAAALLAHRIGQQQQQP